MSTCRRLYWRHIRRHRYEICGSTVARNPVVLAYGCGRPIGPLWHAPSEVWNFVVAGQAQTVVTMRPGVHDGRVAPRAEGVGGILCAACFDRAARDAGLPPFMWKPEPLA